MTAKAVPIEKSEPLNVTTPSDDRFEEAFTAATARPADEAPWERLEAAVVSDENQARQLLDFYRARIAGDVPKPILAVISHRAARFALGFAVHRIFSVTPSPSSSPGNAVGPPG